MMLAFGAMAMSTVSAFNTTLNITSQCLHTNQIQYEDFLQYTFDQSPTTPSPLANIYSTTKTNNEVYNLSEILTQPDKEDFITAMHKEIESMFKDEV